MIFIYIIVAIGGTSKDSPNRNGNFKGLKACCRVLLRSYRYTKKVIKMRYLEITLQQELLHFSINQGNKEYIRSIHQHD